MTTIYFLHSQPPFVERLHDQSSEYHETKAPPFLFFFSEYRNLIPRPFFSSDSKLTFLSQFGPLLSLERLLPSSLRPPSARFFLLESFFGLRNAPRRPLCLFRKIHANPPFTFNVFLNREKVPFQLLPQEFPENLLFFFPTAMQGFVSD